MQKLSRTLLAPPLLGEDHHGGYMEDRGGRSNGVETNALLLRLPTDLLARLDAYKAAVERETRLLLTRTTLLQRIVAAGLDALEQRPPAMPPAAPTDAVGQTPA